MPNILSPALAAAFAGPTFDLEQFDIIGQLTKFNGIPTVRTVSDRVDTFGTLRLEAYNANPRQQGRFDFPRMVWTVQNSDGYFTPGHANELWDGFPPQAWEMRYLVNEYISDGTPQALIDLRMDVVEIQVHDERATLTGIHKLARPWARRWKQEDRHAADWATNAIAHLVTL